MFEYAHTDGIKIADIPYSDNVSPSYASPEWSDFVLSQFEDDELTGGKPNIKGLRRVTESLLGPIVDSGPIQNIPGSDNALTVLYVVTIQFPEGSRTFRSVADAGPYNNSKYPFSTYHACMAETRAEARALKRALQLKVTAAEEIDGAAPNPTDERPFVRNEDEAIQGTQMKMIELRANQLNIDINEFLKENKHTSINEISREEARSLIQLINSYQQDSSKIPTSILKKG